MEFSQTELLDIVARSSTVAERLSPKFLPNQQQIDADKINSRLAEWCQVVAEGNWEIFEKRLAWDNLDLSTVSSILGSVRIVEEQNLPGWVETLNECIKAATNDPPQSPFLRGEQDTEIKFILFEEVFLAFISVARQKLICKVSDSYQLLTEAAHITLERSLLTFLSHLSSKTLQLEFAVFCSVKQGSDYIPNLSLDFKGELYRDFVRSLLEGGLLSFFMEYSVLARLVAMAVDFWVETTAEFLLRLKYDRSEIQDVFHGNVELGKVVAIAPALSDRHHQGRCVIGLTFASGLKLIYKPKKLGIEVAYFQLLDWLNHQDIPLKFKLLKVIDRSTYGWVEFVEPLPCLNERSAKLYYQRTGILLCLMYALEARDCNKENIIACGEYPVLIDMEMLLHPRFRADEISIRDKKLDFLASYELWNSVLRTGFLPRWQKGSKGRYFDTSGLWGVTEKEQPGANVPTLAGVSLSPNNYLEEIIAGFQLMYQFLIEGREEILDSNSPLLKLSKQSIRFLFRSTKIYGFILNKILQPKFLREGTDWSIQLDVLSKGLLASDEKPPLWSLVSVEKQALEQMDIPLFQTYPDSNDLIVGSRTIKKIFSKSSFAYVTSRLQQLDDRDLEKQIEFIRGSFDSYFTNEF